MAHACRSLQRRDDEPGIAETVATTLEPSCEAYGKSIRRDQIEGEVGDLLKSLEPSKNLITFATAMLRY